MDNPWKILGVSENATEEEIKKAYREQARKHHPDRFANSPRKAEEEKLMQRINEAYDYLMKHGTNAKNDWSDQGQYTGNDAQSMNYIRQMIQNGNLSAAEKLLDGMSVRSAQWHYLRGICYLRRGWSEQGRNELGQAVSMDPNNFEYRQAYEQVTQTTGHYRTQSQQFYANNRQDDLCNLCTTLYCMDCCCECMGGDLIPCC